MLDIAHHGRAGGRKWTSAAAGFAAEVGLRPPRYVLRGHNHRIDDSGEKLPFTRYISCPAWQLRTSFGWKVGQARADIGGIIIDGDGVRFEKARYYAAPGGRQIVRVGI